MQPKRIRMSEKFIQEVSEKVFSKSPQEVIHQTIGICNEVYELRYNDTSYILRMNPEKEWIYGTHRFLPIFQKLEIKTPSILAEDYSKREFPFCYQILTKIEGKDLGLVMHKLSPQNLKRIAKEISAIFNKFKTIPPKETFGGMTGLNESKHSSFLEILEGRRASIIQRNKTTSVVSTEILEIYDRLLNDYEDYFLQLKPRLYYDDISSKNVMIHNGQFNGLVDLDFLSKGDYLEAIGAMQASWHGEAQGELYINEIIKHQKLDKFYQNVVRLYAILHLILWTSEEGIRFNSNTSGEVNWANVEKKKRKILDLYRLMYGKP